MNYISKCILLIYSFLFIDCNNTQNYGMISSTNTSLDEGSYYHKNNEELETFINSPKDYEKEINTIIDINDIFDEECSVEDLYLAKYFKECIYYKIGVLSTVENQIIDFINKIQEIYNLDIPFQIGTIIFAYKQWYDHYLINIPRKLPIAFDFNYLNLIVDQLFQIDLEESTCSLIHEYLYGVGICPDDYGRKSVTIKDFLRNQGMHTASTMYQIQNSKDDDEGCIYNCVPRCCKECCFNKTVSCLKKDKSIIEKLYTVGYHSLCCVYTFTVTPILGTCFCVCCCICQDGIDSDGATECCKDCIFPWNISPCYKCFRDLD